MRNYITTLLVGTLCSSALWAQEPDSISINTEAGAATRVEYGRGISYGAKESTAATAVATSDQLTHRTSVNASNLLYGLLPGVQVLQNPNNAWNDGASLLIRGLGTLSTRNPLVLVDGFERSLDYLNASEIESVTVLKDAVSTTLYGIKGANGVILVKTKRGMESAPQIDFSYQFNMGTPRDLPEFVDGYTYARALNEGLENDGMMPRYNAQELKAFQEGTYPDFYPNVNWMDEALRNRSYGNNATFTASGGGKYVKYYSQLNFLDERGILRPTEQNEGYSTQFKYSRLNVRTNLDIQISNSTQLKLNMFGNFSEHNRPGTSTDNIFDALYKVPSGAFPIKTRNNLYGGTTAYANNPIGYIAGTGYARSQGRALFADMELIQNLDFITKGLSFGAKVGLDNYATYWDNNTKSFGYEQATMDITTGKETYTLLRNEGVLGFTNSVGAVSNHFNLEARVGYDRSWTQDHQLNATLLYSMDKDTQKDRNQSTAFVDIVAQAHYMYKNRYIADVSFSGTAASVLQPGNRWGIFPAVGLGWILSEESFLKTDWLNLLKLRASYGVAGRADYEMNLFKNVYGTGDGYYFKDNIGFQQGMRELQLGVKGFTYEKSHKANFGIDFLAWNRLSLTADAYYDHRTDILVDTSGTLSTVLGTTAPKQNSGIVDSYGVELAAKWSDRIGDFSYQAGAMLSYNKNEIKEMNEQYRPYDYLKRTGQSIGQIFGYQVEGIYQSQQQIDDREVKQYLAEVRPGDLMFKDQNGDKRIDEYDQLPLGYSSTCPEIYYSFNLGAEYKGFGVYALFQGSGNYSKVLDVNSVYRPLVSNNTVSTHYYENRWTKENPNARYPRLTYSGSNNNYGTVNSLWVADASFLKLRTLEVYYQLSSDKLKKVRPLKGARLFARAHDLLTWDKIDVMDPEAIKAAHPLMTQYTFGVNLTF